MSLGPVHSLLTNGYPSPLGVDEPPLLSWSPDERQHFVHVRVLNNEDHAVVWDSGAVASTVPEHRPTLDIQSRATYRWQVRISDDAEQWSDWSDYGRWENGLLDADWSAQWIARAVGADCRVARSLSRGEIEWATPGTVLAQTFTAAGPVVSVHADLTGMRDEDVSIRLEVVAVDGDVLAVQKTEGPQHIWDRFMHYVELVPAAPAGDYELRLFVERGRVGWHTVPHAERAHDDDGVSPVRVAGEAFTDGRRRDGYRAIGVETIPAANPVFRGTFDVQGPAERARLYGVALGNGIFRVNGTPVGDELLEPAPTDFRRRVVYRTWDVTSMLRVGRNEISVEAGRGTFALRGANVWGWNLAPWHAEPMIRAQLEWRSGGAGDQIVATGPDWQATSGTTASEHCYGGEVSLSSPDRHEWTGATVASGPGGRLRSSPLPPIRVIETVVPVSTVATGKNRNVYDFGVVLTGRMRCRISGSAGASVRATSGEQITADGRVFSENALAVGDPQVDEHRFLREDELAVWEAKFGYRGFRWVEIETYGDAEVSDVHGVKLHNDVDIVGEFHTDEPVLEWMDGALRRSFLNNLQGIPTDTPIYEKNGWTADAHLASEALLQQLDLRSTLTKWMHDHADAQDATGAVPQIVPSPVGRWQRIRPGAAPQS